MKLSCVIITKNEEKNIGRCFDSLQPVADEIIVIDSFSTDATAEICAQYDVRFIPTKWKGYSDTKNYGNLQASHPYILSIDADEALSVELQKEILEIKQLDTPAEAYQINRLTNYCGKWVKHCGWYPDWKTRLWKKEVGWWEGTIHETLIMKEQVRIRRLESKLLHYSYYEPSDHWKQVDRYSMLLAEKHIESGKRKPGFIKLWLSPVFKFISVFFFRLGILDGITGLRIAWISAHGTHLKYARVKNLLRDNPETINESAN